MEDDAGAELGKTGDDKPDSTRLIWVAPLTCLTETALHATENGPLSGADGSTPIRSSG